MTTLPGFTVRLHGHDPLPDGDGHEAAFTWRGRADDEAEAQALALEDAALAWSATAYGRTGSPPEWSFAFRSDRTACEPRTCDDETATLQWEFGKPAIDRLPRRSGTQAIQGGFRDLVHAAGLTDPAIRGMVLAGLPTAATLHVTSTHGREGATTWVFQDAPPQEGARAPRASRLTLRTLNILGAMNTGFAGSRTLKIDEIVAECRFAVDSATVRAAIARDGAPDPDRVAAILSAAGLGAVADALRAQARTAHEEPEPE